VLSLLLALAGKNVSVGSGGPAGSSYSRTTMNGLPCSSLMTEAANGYVSIGFGITVLADVTYPVTYQYLEGNKLARAQQLMEASATEINLLIAILRGGDGLQDC